MWTPRKVLISTYIPTYRYESKKSYVGVMYLLISIVTSASIFKNISRVLGRGLNIM